MATTTVGGEKMHGPLGLVRTRVTTNESTAVEVARWVVPQKTAIRVKIRGADKLVGGEGGYAFYQAALLVRETGGARVTDCDGAFTLGGCLPAFSVAGDDANAIILTVGPTTGVYDADIQIANLAVNVEA